MTSIQLMCAEKLVIGTEMVDHNCQNETQIQLKCVFKIILQFL